MTGCFVIVIGLMLAVAGLWLCCVAVVTQSLAMTLVGFFIAALGMQIVDLETGHR